MSMNDMLADILKKAIPDDVMKLLTKEQIEKMGANINAFVTDIKDNFQTIIAAQSDNHVTIMNEITSLKKDLQDEYRDSRGTGNSGNGGSRSRKPSGSAD